ncbi:hypothetical protein VUR80DRAFT_797 [Thermomyces stellatus]
MVDQRFHAAAGSLACRLWISRHYHPLPTQYKGGSGYYKSHQNTLRRPCSRNYYKHPKPLTELVDVPYLLASLHRLVPGTETSYQGLGFLLLSVPPIGEGNATPWMFRNVGRGSSVGLLFDGERKEEKMKKLVSRGRVLWWSAPAKALALMTNSLQPAPAVPVGISPAIKISRSKVGWARCHYCFAPPQGPLLDHLQASCQRPALFIVFDLKAGIDQSMF